MRVLWYAAMGLKAFAVYRLVSTGLIRTYWAFGLFIAFTTARSAILSRIDYRQYATFSFATVPLALLTEAVAIWATFWVLTEQFPAWRRVGHIFLAALVCMGLGVALAVRLVAAPVGWEGAWETGMSIQQYSTVAMAVVLFGVRALAGFGNHIPIRQSAIRVADVLLLDVLFGVVTASVTMAYGKQAPFVASLLPMVTGIANGLLWSLWLPSASNESREFARPSSAERADFVAHSNLLASRKSLRDYINLSMAAALRANEREHGGKPSQ